MIVDFNASWKFSRTGQPCTTVHLPHDAMLEGQRDGSCRNGVNSGYFPGGKYTYEKTFEISGGDVGKKIVLHFEGVYQNCTIALNGKNVGAHKYGYTAFDVDISGTVQAGENHLRVDVDNSLEPNCRWYSGSGIYRPVSLLIDEYGVAVTIYTASGELHQQSVPPSTWRHGSLYSPVVRMFSSVTSLQSTSVTFVSSG